MPRMHKNVYATTLYKIPTLGGTKELKYTFLYKQNFIRTLRLNWVKKQEHPKNNWQAEIPKKQFLIQDVLPQKANVAHRQTNHSISRTILCKKCI